MQNKNIIKKIYLICCGLALILSAGCSVKITDISNDAYYSQYIGNKYIVLKDMEIKGSIPDHSTRRIAGYFVVLPPGVGGPEICPLGTLPQGSVIEIVRICKDNIPFLFGLNIEFYAKTTEETLRGKEFRVYSAFGAYKRAADNQHYILNDAFFKLY